MQQKDNLRKEEALTRLKVALRTSDSEMYVSAFREAVSLGYKPTRLTASERSLLDREGYDYSGICSLESKVKREESSNNIISEEYSNLSSEEHYEKFGVALEKILRFYRIHPERHHENVYQKRQCLIDSGYKTAFVRGGGKVELIDASDGIIGGMFEHVYDRYLEYSKTKNGNTSNQSNSNNPQLFQTSQYDGSNQLSLF